MPNRKSKKSKIRSFANRIPKQFMIPRWVMVVFIVVIVFVGVYLVFSSTAANGPDGEGLPPSAASLFPAQASRLYCVSGNCTDQDPGGNRSVVQVWVRRTWGCAPTHKQWALRVGNDGRQIPAGFKNPNQWLCVKSVERVRAAQGPINNFPLPGGSWAGVNNGHPYNAYDIFGAPGTPVRAAYPGVVVDTGSYSITIRGDNGLIYFYQHIEVGVSSGRVAAGQVIGAVSGNPASGNNGSPHLHFDVSQGVSNRIACERSYCPAANAAHFVDVAAYLRNAQGRGK